LGSALTAAFEADLPLSTARQNEVVKKFASWGALLAVPAAITSIYGMIFKYMPELEWSFGYPAVLLPMVAICVTLYFVLRIISWH
jgi:magnesium transporter